MNEYINFYAYKDVFFLLLLVSFLLIAILKALYWKHTKLLLRGTFYQRYANQFLREDNVFTERVNVITLGVLILNLSLFIAYFFNIIVLSNIALLIAQVAIFYLLKTSLIFLLARIFMLREIGRLAIFFSLLFDRSFGILIFPLLVCLYFFLSQTVIIPVLIIAFFSVIFVLKVFWLWRISIINFGFSHFYIFLYLCLLEIFPVLLLIKIKIY
jgi:hypothetical protein